MIARRVLQPYWRTALLMVLVGVATTMFAEGSLPVLMATLGSAFVFSEYENRYKLSVGWIGRAMDAVIRVGVAVLWTGLLYYLTKKQHFG
ncbi:MAG: hypothetical protein ABW110_21145 [Steroidobacteraceae bacterium]